ncbi:MAG TPA: site-specific integrase [Tepidisphaeraceae bacterium]|jgi:integrase
MPKLAEDRVPAYSRHRASGQAVVTIDNRDIYLGKWNTLESRQKYNRIIGEWQANGRRLPVPERDVLVVEIIDRFAQHAQVYYRTPDGTPTGEWKNFRLVLHQLRLVYGKTPAVDFGPLALKALRNRLLAEHEIEDRKTKKRSKVPGWSRTFTNRQISRVKHVFKWALGEQMIPAAVHQAMLAVEGIRQGRSEARETEPVKPVAEEHVRAVFPFVSRQVRAMLELQLLTGARGGELFGMRAVDIDRSAPVWVYRPAQHKTLHHGHTREIRLGKRAQAIVTEFLTPNLTAFLFSPIDGERERREKAHRRRVDQQTTPLSCGNVPGSNRTAHPKRAPKAQYTKDSYARAVARAIVRANIWLKGGWVCGNEDVLIPHFHPHQIRHTAGTRLREEYGLEAAQVILGHRTLKVTELYAEKNVKLAERIVAEVG